MNTRLLALLMLLATLPARANDTLCARLDRAAPQPRVDWVRTERAGIVSYRDGAGTEAVTAALYAFMPKLTPPERERVALAAAEFGRSAELQLAPNTVRVSPVTTRRTAGGRRLCYWGVDAATARRFVSVRIASAETLLHVYYEAVGLREESFVQHAKSTLSGPQNWDSSIFLAPLPVIGTRLLPLPTVTK